MKCNQPNCLEPPTHRVFWPGRSPAFSCGPHADKAVAIGGVMGCYIHTEPLTPDQLIAGDLIEEAP